MRSVHEGFFRIRQELANLAMLSAPPRMLSDVLQQTPLSPLPDPRDVVERLRGSQFEADIARLAKRILSHDLPVLGFELRTGPDIAWRHDYVNGRSSKADYFRRIPYLDFSRVGDHKVIWELNRHQHLVLLAQAYRFTGDPGCVSEIDKQMLSWSAANPFLRGINWTSALEVASRLLSWIWVYHLVGDGMTTEMRGRITRHLYQHGCYLEHNLSIYFSPNTHLLGEGVALHALGTLFPSLPRSTRWVDIGQATVATAIARQVRADGSHFEQSSYYHGYALDWLLFHRAVGGTVAASVLGAMADYLAALMGPSRILPFLGDDDGGRVFHPYGRRDRFGRATLATCATVVDGHDWPYGEEDLHEQAVWWFECRREPPVLPVMPRTLRLFEDAGVVVFSAANVQIVVDAGSFGAGSSGHSHSDTLSVIARVGEEEILIDPGTYTYVADPPLRDLFRSSALHSTVRVDRRDQGTPVGPFRWLDPPEVRIERCRSTAAGALLTATCRYDQVLHRRTIVLSTSLLLLVSDELEGSLGEHLVEQFWHFGQDVVQSGSGVLHVGAGTRIAFRHRNVELLNGGECGWRSEVFGQRAAAPVARLRLKTTLPVSMATMFDFSGTGRLIDFDASTFEALIQTALT